MVAILASAGCGSDEESTIWHRDGQLADTDVIESYQGSQHCDHEEVTFLRVKWPLGTADGLPRMYVRDPEDVLDEQTEASFQADVELPGGAHASGYSSSVGELWFAGANEDSLAYVVSQDGDQVEAWPRTKTLVGCD